MIGHQAHMLVKKQQLTPKEKETIFFCARANHV